MAVYGFNDNKTKADISALIQSSISGKASITKFFDREVGASGVYISTSEIPANALMVLVATNLTTGVVTNGIYRRSDQLSGASHFTSTEWNSTLNKLALTRIDVTLYSRELRMSAFYLDALTGSSSGMPNPIFQIQLYMIKPENA